MVSCSDLNPRPFTPSIFSLMLIGLREELLSVGFRAYGLGFPRISGPFWRFSGLHGDIIDIFRVWGFPSLAVLLLGFAA